MVAWELVSRVPSSDVGVPRNRQFKPQSRIDAKHHIFWSPNPVHRASCHKSSVRLHGSSTDLGATGPSPGQGPGRLNPIAGQVQHPRIRSPAWEPMSVIESPRRFSSCNPRDEDPLFRNGHCQPLDRYGMRYILGKDARTATWSAPSLADWSVYPEVMRYCCAPWIVPREFWETAGLAVHPRSNRRAV